MPKIIINSAINLFLTATGILLFSNSNNFRVLFDKIPSVYFFEKCIYILALQMASTWNHHRANCIGTFILYVDNNARSRSEATRLTFRELLRSEL